MSQWSPCFSRMFVARAVTFTASPLGRRPRSVSVPTTQATPWRTATWGSLIVAETSAKRASVKKFTYS